MKQKKPKQLDVIAQEVWAIGHSRSSAGWGAHYGIARWHLKKMAAMRKKLKTSLKTKFAMEQVLNRLATQQIPKGLKGLQ